MSKRRWFGLVSVAALLIVVLLGASVLLQSEAGDSAPVPTVMVLPTIEKAVVASSVNAVPVVQVEPTAVELPSLPESESPLEVVANQVIIRFEPDTSPEERVAYVQSFGGTIQQEIDALQTVVVSLPVETNDSDLTSSSLVVDTEPDYYVTALIDVPTSDEYYPDQWALPVIGAPEAWASLPDDAATVTVAVIDSGVCLDHPDLAGKILAGYDFVEDDDTPQDEFAHGCGVAGIIAATIDNGIGMAGVAPNARIMPLRVLDASGIGTYSDVAAAIVQAVDDGAQIINLSLGGANTSSTLENALDYASANDVLVIAAAGNTGSDVLYPAAYDSVIAVGSIDADGEISSFSNRGDTLDLLAPGRDILTTNLTNDYTFRTGTSFAAPQVAGIAALEIAQGETLTLDGGVVTIANSQQDNDDTSIVAAASDFCTTVNVLQSECEALEALYNSTDGDNWTNNTNWLSGTQVQYWHGVTVNTDGHVVRIELEENGLVGSIPTELGNLPQLYSLFLGSNQLSGTIPSALANLSNLEQLDLGFNQLSGTIPTALSTLPNLFYLNLYSNQLTGGIPPELGDLSSISWLLLGDNPLEGSIPAELGNLSNITWIDLGMNQLTGSIPSELANLTELWNLTLADNELTGSIPPELGDLSNLAVLLLDVNELEGEIPPELGDLTLLEYLGLSNNQLTGSIPPELANLTALEQLDLANNRLSGTIPDEIGDLTNLKNLFLQNNALSGEVPATISNLVNLATEDNQPYLPWSVDEEVDLGYNALYSTNSTVVDFLDSKDVDWADTQTIAPTDLQVDDVGNLSWTAIPYMDDDGYYEIYYKLSSDSEYMLHGNTTDKTVTTYPVTGLTSGANYDFRIRTFTSAHDNQQTDLYSEFSTEASGLIYAFCALVTDIPQSECVALESLYNSTDGDNWTDSTGWLTDTAASNWYGVTLNTDGHVVSVDLEGNGLVGIVPAELGDLPNTYYLNLSSNQLSGTIPSELANLSNMEQLDLGYNQLSGSIPPELGNLSDLRYLTLYSNQLTGSIPPELANLSNLEYLLLADNLLEGSIPSELGNLSSVTWLDLGTNQLTGSIPPELSNLTGLFNLTLADNELTGSIPPELSNLTNLTALALDVNDLEGDIPTELSNLAQLEYLGLGHNHLTGSIPSELSELANLTQLDLSSNCLEGTIPEAIGSLANLETLLLQNNALSGEVPAAITNLVNLDTADNQPYYSWSEDDEVDFGYNMLSANRMVTAFLDSKDPAWANTQTVPPSNFRITVNSSTKITLTWTPPLYTGNSGGYDIGIRELPDGEWSYMYLVPKTASKHTRAGLTSGVNYAFRVSTTTNAHGDQQNTLESEFTGELRITPEIPSEPPAMCATTNILQSECEALATLYYNTYGANWIDNTDWLKEPLVQYWHGVEIDDYGHVIALDLSDNALDGVIPPEIGNLSYLTRLNLDMNELEGEIPPELGNLSRLTYLSLSYNQLTGSIPPELSELVYLTQLDLSSNCLDGAIPSEIGNLTNLETLLLQNNALIGEVPEAITKLVNLDTEDNKPDYSWTDDDEVDLSYNMLYSTDSTTADFLDSKDPNWVNTQTLPPSNFQVVSVMPDRVKLSWTPSSYGGYYVVYARELPDGEWPTAGAALMSISASSYTQTGLTSGINYAFRVQVIKGAHGDQQNGLYSEYTNVVTSGVLPETGSLPAAPSGLTLDSVSQTQIDLSWTDNTDDETAFHIEWSPDGTFAWVEIATVESDVTTFSDPGLSCGTEHHYRVRAYRADDEQYSPYSNVVDTVTTSCPAPAAPTDLQATSTSSTQIALSWTDNSANEMAFYIERSLDGSTNWVEVGTATANSTEYVDENLTCETTYYYRVRAYQYGIGYSAYSDLADATTMSCVLPTDTPGPSPTWTWVPTETSTPAGTPEATEEPGTFSCANLSLENPAFFNNHFYVDVINNNEEATEVTRTYVIWNDALVDYPDMALQWQALNSAMFWTGGDTTSPTDSADTGDGTFLSSSDRDLPGSGSILIWEMAFSYGPANLTSYLTAADFNGTTLYLDHPTETTDCALVFTVPEPPVAPSALAAEALSESEISLSWTDNSEDETAFYIERSLNGSTNWVRVAIVDENTTTYTDNSVSPATSYFYWVRAYRKSDSTYSVYSNIASTTTPSLPQSGPTFTVTTPEDQEAEVCRVEHCTLREAITAANENSGTDTIAFNISGDSPYTIQPLSALPQITDPVILDGWSQPDFAGTPIIEINGELAGEDVDGLHIIGGDSTVRGLVVNRFDRYGVRLSTEDSNIVVGNYVGTDVTGTVDLGNGWSGIRADSGSSYNTIGGTTSQERNIVSGNGGNGIQIYDEDYNVIQGNYVGTDATGTLALGNDQRGISLSGDDNMIGGTDPGSRNIISGNGVGGSSIANYGIGLGGEDNIVQGNYIGTDVTGMNALPNLGNGMRCAGRDNLIGGTTPEERNIISGNAESGVYSTYYDCSIVGNYIGTDVTGMNALPNSEHGVQIVYGKGDVGDDTPGGGNVISGNGGDGVRAEDSSTSAVHIQNNYIGVAADGVTPLGNGGNGVAIDDHADSIDVGDIEEYQGNVIAYNSGAGVWIGSGDNDVWGNAIYANDGLGIDIEPVGVLANDLNNDAGSDYDQNYPIVIGIVSNDDSQTIHATLYSSIDSKFHIEFFSNETCDSSDYGEGQIYLGYTYATTDSNGNVAFTYDVPPIPEGYFITATASNRSIRYGTSEFSQCFQVALPTPPTDLTATLLDATSIELNWMDNSNTETAFHIERSLDGSNWTEIDTVGSDVTRYVDTTVISDTIYYYRVRDSKDEGTVYSTYSNSASEATLPNVPTDLTVVLNAGLTLDLAWTDHSVIETAFQIERSLDGLTDWTEIASTEADVVSYQDVLSQCYTPYHYRVRAYDGDHEHYSDYSTVAQATTDCLPLTAPSDLTATVFDDVFVDLSWVDNTPYETNYQVERSLDGLTDWTEMAGLGADVTTYQDAPPQCYTTFYYRVRAYQSVGDYYSDYSPAVNITTSCPEPLQPTGLTVTGLGRDQIQLTWVDDDPWETQYRVEHSVNLVVWQEIVVLAADTTTYTHTDLRCNSQHYYRIRTFRADDDRYSVYSDVVLGTAQSCPPMDPPGNNTPTNVTRNTATLSWTNPAAEDITTFHIERAQAVVSATGVGALEVSSWQQIAVIPGGLTTYTETDLACDTTYAYRIRGFREEDETYSPYSDTLTVTTETCPTAVTNTIGLYQGGVWQFRDSNSRGSADLRFAFGPRESGWTALVGDWDGDGVDGVGVYKDGIWYLRNSASSGDREIGFRFNALDDALPLVGDWDGDGVDTIGLYLDGVWVLRNSLDQGEPDIIFCFGMDEEDWLPVVGDWNNIGSDRVGLYRNGVWYLHESLTSVDRLRGFYFGPQESGWLPVIGDWDADGVDTVGVYQNGIWRLRNSNNTGVIDLGFNFVAGESGWQPVASYRGGVSGLSALGLGMEWTPDTADDEATATPTVESEVTEEPSVTEIPEVTEEAVITEDPTATEEPVMTETPVATATEVPVITEETIVTEVPIATETPTATEAPTAIPTSTPEPVTEAPQVEGETTQEP